MIHASLAGLEHDAETGEPTLSQDPRVTLQEVL